ncbi:phage major capsid protein [Ureibacillus composti]|nr:phage major capsid protein [Ureibacillus composti]
MNKEQLLARKAEIAAILADETRSIDNLDELETELRDINSQIASIEKREQLMSEARSINESSANAQTITTFNGILQNENRCAEQKETEYRQAFMNYVLRGEKIPTELRETTLTTDVGSVIPQTVLNRIIEKLEATGMILPLVTRTSIKGGVTVPTSTVKPTASWVAEGAGSTTQKKNTGTITFSYHKLRCAVAVSIEVDTMALAVFEQTLINNVVEAMTKAIEQAIISGDGIGKPKGILAETPEAGQALDVAKLEYKTLANAEGALPLEYEAGAIWVMTKKTFTDFQAMTDLNDQPIARVNYGIGGATERTLLGRRVVLCNYVDSFSTAAVGNPFAFLFNFNDYILNTNYQMGVKKYEDNETDDLVTKAIMVVDGKVIEKGSLVVLKKAAAV